MLEVPDSPATGTLSKIKLKSGDFPILESEETIFDKSYLSSRNEKYPLNLTTLTNVPHSKELYSVDAGMVEKGKVMVQVFEISTTYATVFTALDAENKSYELDNLLKVGSMDEASLNGNWGE
jgi:hypothetical protein